MKPEELFMLWRRFNRVHTQSIGLLGRTLSGSPFSLTEGRLLYDIGHGEPATSAMLARRLGLDPAYLARLVAKLEAAGLLWREKKRDDRRAALLALTGKGEKVLQTLEDAAMRDAEALLGKCDEAGRRRVARALKTIMRELGGAEQASVELVIRPHRPGDVSLVIHQQTRLYHEEYDWDIGYEALAGGIGARFLAEFKPDREACWIAELDGEVCGAVFLVEKEPGVAQLRLLHVEAWARGRGIGARLVALCTEFARARGYEHIMLWTNDVLAGARKLYEAEGYQLVESEPHHSFGTELVGQYWQLDLRGV